VLCFCGSSRSRSRSGSGSRSTSIPRSSHRSSFLSPHICPLPAPRAPFPTNSLSLPPFLLSVVFQLFCRGSERTSARKCFQALPRWCVCVFVCVCVCLCANLCGLSLSPALSLSYSLPSMEERMISSPTQPPSPPEISLPFPRFPRPQKSTIKTSHGPEYISRAAPKNLQET